MHGVSVNLRASRAHTWLEGAGDWTWPGQSGAAAAELLPPPWVPAFPRRLEQAIAQPAAPAAGRRRGATWRGLLIGTLLASVAVVSAALALNGRLGVERLLGVRTAAQPAPSLAVANATPQPLPTLVAKSQDAAGSSIDTASYTSSALHRQGSFIAYLPPGYASTTRRYPVLYLLDGNDQPASAFLEVGLQGELDTLIARHAIPPLIAVMIQGGPGANNWRNVDGLHYESYVLEVQELVDRTLPTVADRDGRAIAGDSMGGYGSMNVALSHPERFATVESWLGFFNGLEGRLRTDRPYLARHSLRAFVYGGESDDIANPDEDAPFAAALRKAGADARSAVYPGGHSLETVHAHLASQLVFAGHALASG
jgi:enterochelin esterase-like enzyme